jgi:hypothetical protein
MATQSEQKNQGQAGSDERKDRELRVAKWKAAGYRAREGFHPSRRFLNALRKRENKQSRDKEEAKRYGYPMSPSGFKLPKNPQFLDSAY